MKIHTKIYLDFFGYGEQDFIPSEVSGQRSNDVHHLIFKGMGSSKDKEFIENLVSLTREEHNKAHDDPDYNKQVQIIHLRFIQIHRPDYEIRFDYRHLID